MNSDGEDTPERATPAMRIIHVTETPSPLQAESESKNSSGHPLRKARRKHARKRGLVLDLLRRHPRVGPSPEVAPLVIVAQPGETAPPVIQRCPLLTD